MGYFVMKFVGYNNLLYKQPVQLKQGAVEYCSSSLVGSFYVELKSVVYGASQLFLK